MHGPFTPFTPTNYNVLYSTPCMRDHRDLPAEAERKRETKSIPAVLRHIFSLPIILLLFGSDADWISSLQTIVIVCFNGLSFIYPQAGVLSLFLLSGN